MPKISTIPVSDPDGNDLILASQVNDIGDPITKNFTVQSIIDLAVGGGGEIAPPEYIDTEISSAQLLDLHNTPITLVPTQGSGVAVFVDKMVTKYTFVTTPYSHYGNSTLGLYILYATEISNLAADSVDKIDTSQDYYESKNNATDVFGAVAAIENKDVTLFTDSAITLGDGTLKIRTYYSVIETGF